MIWFILVLIILGFWLGFDILLLIILAVIVGVIIWVIKTEADLKKEDEVRFKNYEDAKKREWNVLEEKQRIYDLKKDKIITKYGIPDKTIYIEWYNLKKEIMVFKSSKMLLLLGEEISFDDVINCTISDNPIVEKGKIEYNSKTTTNNGSMLGRAVVGGVLAGGAGAIIGGATASKNTYTTAVQGNDIIVHNYTVVININNLARPIIRIHLGKDETHVNEIVGLMNVIISNNNK